MSTQTEFNDAYWASQPPAVQALREIPEGSDRMAQAVELATKGYAIDTPIMGWNWDPYQVMLLREQYGYKWVPSTLQSPVAMAPGLNTPGLVQYDPNNPPAGSIAVSTSVVSYPAYVDPAANVHPQAPATLVGFDEGAGYFSALAAAAAELSNGETYTKDPRGTFIFTKVATPAGWTMYFKKA